MIKDILGGGLVDLSVMAACGCACNCTGQSGDYSDGYFAGTQDKAKGTL